jgi:Ca2+-binding RTX toxin-like protein
VQRLLIEHLESRRLLSANQISYDDFARSIVIEGTTGNDSAWVWTDANSVHVQLLNQSGTKSASFSKSSVDWVRYFGGAGDDRFENASSVHVQAWGAAGNDLLIGGSGNDDLLGEDGNDWLYGVAGDDALIGGKGDDTLYGGDGKDGLSAEDGNDELYGEAGSDWLSGAAGNDVILAGLGEDYILGGSGDDTLIGGEDDDTIHGEEGHDTLSGLAGDDFLVGDIGDDSLHGGDGNDSLSGEDGRDSLYGDAGDDWLSGAAGNDLIVAGAGKDYVLGGSGDDGVSGDDGDDTLYGELGNDYLMGLGGDDTLIGGGGDDILYGGADKDALSGEDGNDQIFGDAGDDWLSGASGSDIILGGVGVDYILGGFGDDTLLGEDGNDSLYGEQGNDLLSGLAGDDFVVGAEGDDTLYGGDGKDALSGEDGADRLFGDAGDDWLSGAADNDLVSGGIGDDYILGGMGNDYLHGGDDDDLVYGNEGNDFLWGWNGKDLLVGGVGDDSLTGGNGEDALQGEDGNDQLYGQADVDGLWGGAGHDILMAGAGEDFVVGGAGADILDGGEDVDWLQGGDGNDILFGGAGKDELRGENGDDILVGGTTIHGENPSRLQALIFAWGSNAPYSARVSQISNELFSSRLRSEDTVYDDHVPDALFGGEGQDWFFQTGHMGVYTPLPTASPGHGHDQGSGHHSGPFIVRELPELEGFALIDSLDKFADRQSSETIHSLVPHADNTAHQREHLALFELVRYDQVTHIAVASGSWSSAATWKNGVVPGNGARVLIPYGVEITVDGMIQSRIATIRVDGTLSFHATRNTELRADTVVIGGSGAFEMGTAENPIAAGVKARLLITDNGPIDRSWDPFAISRGLVAHGKVSIYGAEVTPYAAIAGGAVAGSRALALSFVPSGWRVGDTLVIAATVTGATQNEVRTIVGLTGSSVILDRSLSFNHLAPAPHLQVHAANTTRNAVIESESTAADRRGHVMFMHNRDVDIQFAGFYRLGRTDKMVPINDSVVQSDWTLKPGTGANQRARYSVHFHRNGLSNDGNPARIIGSAVVDSPGWGFVNHSSYVDMIANVAFDVRGAAFATEVGDEIGGFYSNLAIGSTGSGEEINSREFLYQDFGHQGDGFWFQGGGVSVVGNISAGHEGHAFVYYTRGLIESMFATQFPAANLADPSIARGQPMIPISDVPVTNFRDNVGYASAVGLKMRYHRQETSHWQDSLFEDSRFWNNTLGVGLHYAQNIVLRNLAVIHAPGSRPPVGIDSGIIEGNITYDNLTVIGYVDGIVVPRWGNNVINGGTFNNINHDILIPTAAWRDRSLLLTGFAGTPRIALWEYLAPIEYQSAEIFLVRDNVVLNFGPFVNQRAYFTTQRSTAIPFPTAREDVPSAYVGKTNLQLWLQFGKAIGGEIAPPNTYSAPHIEGGLIVPLGGAV